MPHAGIAIAYLPPGLFLYLSALGTHVQDRGMPPKDSAKEDLQMVAAYIPLYSVNHI